MNPSDGGSIEAIPTGWAQKKYIIEDALDLFLKLYEVETPCNMRIYNSTSR
jgi:hypothetical protein